MKKILSIAIVTISLFGATLSSMQESDAIVEALQFGDGNESCLLVQIDAKIVGTQQDGPKGDEVLFTIYDDGRIIAKKSLFVPIGRAMEVNATIRYDGTLSQQSPGIAVESEELGLYIDPLIPKKMDGNCDDYLHKDEIEAEYNQTCMSLAKFGIRCEVVSE